MLPHHMTWSHPCRCKFPRFSSGYLLRDKKKKKIEKREKNPEKLNNLIEQHLQSLDKSQLTNIYHNTFPNSNHTRKTVHLKRCRIAESPSFNSTSLNMSKTIMTSLFLSVSMLTKYRQETLIGLRKPLK